MKVILWLQDRLVRKVLRFAAGNDPSGRQQRERRALELSFEKFEFRVGKRARERADLHDRNLRDRS